MIYNLLKFLPATFFVFPMYVSAMKAGIPYVFYIDLNPAPSIILDTKLSVNS